MRYPVVALALLVAGCAAGPPVASPAVAAPDLRGTWSGTWGGAPLTVIVIEQRTGHGESGLVIGPWQVLGEHYPTVSGVMTSSIRGEMVSTHMDGLVSDAGGRLVITVRARSAAGDQRMTLRLVDADRLEGAGDSQFSWGPRGPVQLARRAQPRAAVSSASGWRFRAQRSRAICSTLSANCGWSCRMRLKLA
jgi:hypothetical protein